LAAVIENYADRDSFATPNKSRNIGSSNDDDDVCTSVSSDLETPIIYTEQTEPSEGVVTTPVSVNKKKKHKKKKI
jgi:hypothetical protein